MRILVAIDTHPYSVGILNEVAKLTANTWADITILGVQQKKTAEKPDTPLADALSRCKETFFGHLPVGAPYTSPTDLKMAEIQDGVWENTSIGRKEFTLKIRTGDTVKEILAEARERECDLIILGCNKANDCEWDGEIMHLPQKIARDADCSVLVIKEEKIPDKVICCLDQNHVSQESLEMINQIVTLHQADLKVVGLTGPKGLPGKGDVETRMNEVLQYYTARKINTLIKLVDNDDLEEYVGHATKEGLIALWIGKKSLLGKIFSKDLISKLVATSNSSVLILR